MAQSGTSDQIVIVDRHLRHGLLIKGVIATEIKTDKNTCETLDQDLMDGVSCVTSKARDVAKSRQSISDLMTMT